MKLVRIYADEGKLGKSITGRPHIREGELDNPDFDCGPMFGEKKRASKELEITRRKQLKPARRL